MKLRHHDVPKKHPHQVATYKIHVVFYRIITFGSRCEYISSVNLSVTILRKFPFNIDRATDLFRSFKFSSKSFFFSFFLFLLSLWRKMCHVPSYA
jgi:hypothetical protein